MVSGDWTLKTVGRGSWVEHPARRAGGLITRHSSPVLEASERGRAGEREGGPLTNDCSISRFPDLPISRVLRLFSLSPFAFCLSSALVTSSLRHLVTFIS